MKHLASLCQQEESADIIESCYCAVQFFLKPNIAGNIFSSDLCKKTVKAGKRNCKEKKKKNPLPRTTGKFFFSHWRGYVFSTRS